MLIKISVRIILDLYKLDLKFIQKRKGQRMAKMILKKNKEERPTLPVIKTYYKAIDIKELVQEWTNRPMEQNRGPRNILTCI